MRVKVCPACDSQKVRLVQPEKWDSIFSLQRDECKNCGYRGPMTMMEKSDADTLTPVKPKIKINTEPELLL